METEHGAAIEVPPDERGGNRLAVPKSPRHASTLQNHAVEPSTAAMSQNHFSVCSLYLSRNVVRPPDRTRHPARLKSSKRSVRADCSAHRAGAPQGATSSRQFAFDLEVCQEVLGEQTELLPAAVGLAVLREDGVESQVALEFYDGLLAQSPSAHEALDGACAQGQVGGHGAVLVGSVVGIEEVELVVLSGGVHDLLPENDHPEGTLSFLDGYLGSDGVRAVFYPLPSALSGNLSREIEPLQEGHLDSVARLVLV